MFFASACNCAFLILPQLLASVNCIIVFPLFVLIEVWFDTEEVTAILCVVCRVFHIAYLFFVCRVADSCTRLDAIDFGAAAL